MSGGEGFEPERPALGLKDTGLDEPVEGAQKGAEASAPGENPVCDPSGLTIGSTRGPPRDTVLHTQTRCPAGARTQALGGSSHVPTHATLSPSASVQTPPLGAWGRGLPVPPARPPRGRLGPSTRQPFV